MYATHQARISASGRGSASGFKQVCVFVLSTIRVQLPQACDATKRYIADGERAPAAFFGAKLKGLDWLEMHAEGLWRGCEDLATRLSGRELENALIDVLLDIPGIGFAKAGFIAQMIYGCSGCIDTHNLVRFGLKPRSFTQYIAALTPRNRQKHIARYNATVAQCGGTARLWDDWCEYVAERQGYGTAEDVSAMHLVAI
jgi:hypothetical protein